MYFKRLFLALIGMPLIDDRPIRYAHGLEVADLYSSIPYKIEGQTNETSSENLVWMLDRIAQDRAHELPIDKQGRWIGFVHGVLAATGHLDVNEVRNRSRSRFHEAYRATGQKIPKTQNRTD